MKEYPFELILGATSAKALRLRAAVLVAFFATVLLAPLSSSAQSGDAESLAKAAQNPIADMVSLPLQNNTNFDFGPLKKTQNILNIQPVYPVNLNAEWNLITRTIVPVISQPALTSGEDCTFGIGDIQFSAFGPAGFARLRRQVMRGVGRARRACGAAGATQAQRVSMER